MTEQQHPITPPPELVREWWAQETYDPFGVAVSNLAIQAARWSANRELDKCLQLLDINGCPSKWIDMLRAARRPKKPPSLKEQALEELTKIEDNEETYFDSSVIRRALEQLDD